MVPPSFKIRCHDFHNWLSKLKCSSIKKQISGHLDKRPGKSQLDQCLETDSIAILLNSFCESSKGQLGSHLSLNSHEKPISTKSSSQLASHMSPPVLCSTALAAHPSEQSIQNLKKGLRLYDQRDFELALSLYKLSAAQGNFCALHNIGVMCLHGQGVNCDYSLALSCFLKGAVRGMPASMCQLGYMYLYGKGRPTNYGQALHYFHRASQYASPYAEYHLGLLYLKGLGVTSNLRKAVHYLKLAASHGYAPAQYNLGTMYYSGCGVPQDLNESSRLYQLAAAQGIPEASANLAVMYALGLGQNYHKSYDFCGTAAENEVVEGMYNIGLAYLHGKGIRKIVTWSETNSGDQLGLKTRKRSSRLYCKPTTVARSDPLGTQ